MYGLMTITSTDKTLYEAERTCYRCNKGSYKLGTIGCADICEKIYDTIVNLDGDASSYPKGSLHIRSY